MATTLWMIFWLLVVFIGGLACGIPGGRWIERRRRKGMSYEEILEEAKARVRK
jgi:hypothetical protein